MSDDDADCRWIAKGGRAASLAGTDEELMTMKLFVGVFLIGLAASACAATQHGPAWTRVEQCAGDPARCSSGCASGDGNMCALFAVLDVEAHQPTLDSLPIKKVRDLVVDTRAACLVSREPRACAASDLAATAYAKRPDHDAELLASSARARASQCLIT